MFCFVIMVTRWGVTTPTVPKPTGLGVFDPQFAHVYTRNPKQNICLFKKRRK